MYFESIFYLLSSFYFYDVFECDDNLDAINLATICSNVLHKLY